MCRYEGCEFSYIPIAVCLSAREGQHMPGDVLLPSILDSTRHVLCDRHHDHDDGPWPPDSDVLRKPFLALGPSRQTYRVAGIQVVHGFQAEVVQVAAHPTELVQEILPPKTRDGGSERFLGSEVE